MSLTTQLLIAGVGYLLLWIISWWAAIGRGWGPAESAHAAQSRWLYVRRLLLALLALLGISMVGGMPLASLGWQFSLWLLPILLVGGLMGAKNKGGFEPSGFTPLALALFHTFATELYFRGYLFHHVASLIGWWALPLSALAYGCYYLTVHTVWAAGWRGRLAGFLLFTTLGVVFAGFYTISGSFLGAWLGHFAAVLRFGYRR
ncbi:CPBP family glutamic-type intramembrane protease [Candidatus Viridilinea mediisalina]|uniref:CAAX prenyl protease 2/Lysostaphin resistance protein A-like domain-containing protein n=1 Tax=Candidatus Viridilinea mediisalina TaxID=2024553 RepID=A0A2A6RDL2_9CHLR|nr:CPBP family glutamic-type intramembrane protease [Candidatus Viridilinea mediisalina]PDV99381.1 hypothetical protein CJ255_21545 [Candidatus Viridilinea mediisalina]